MFEVDWKNTTSAEDAPDARGIESGWLVVVEALIPPLLTGWFAPGHGRCPSCKSPAFWRRPG